MSSQVCERCGSTDGTVRARRIARSSAELCDPCADALGGVSGAWTGLGTTWVITASLLLGIAAVAALVILGS